MDYVELNIPLADAEQGEILTAELADFPFESFQTDGMRLKAYIPQEALADCMGDVDNMLSGYAVEGARYISIETQNWNAQWESNFDPVEVGDKKLLIRAPFHESRAEFGLEVVIMPKMSFGTGHHATTHLMSEATIDLKPEGLEGLDMGSGTGLLAIVAAKCGAAHMDAIDIDDWAYENCAENIEVNGVGGCVTPYLGNASLLVGKSYDFILANINRNILLADMSTYVAALRGVGSQLVMSGFLEDDVEILEKKANELGMSLAEKRVRDGWVVLRFTKN
ncbi:MAG: 50S ribosomal protein L11 methyltransferase [Rikenellaceae bacterium]